MEDGATVALKLWSTANQREARSTWLATHFAVQAAAANLPGATAAVHILWVGDKKIRGMRTRSKRCIYDRYILSILSHIPCTNRSWHSRCHSTTQCFLHQQRRHPWLFVFNSSQKREGKESFCETSGTRQSSDAGVANVFERTKVALNKWYRYRQCIFQIVQTQNRGWKWHVSVGTICAWQEVSHLK